MALYDLTDEQAKNTKTWLRAITVSGDFEARENINAKMKEVLIALDKPINPKGKPKEIID